MDCFVHLLWFRGYIPPVVAKIEIPTQGNPLSNIDPEFLPWLPQEASEVITLVDES